MKPHFDNKPATAALEAFVSSSFPVSAKAGSHSFSLRDIDTSIDVQDLLNAADEIAFPDITWDSVDEEEVEAQSHSCPLPPTRGFAMDHYYGQRTNNLRALARSKTLRTSISSLGGPATHLSRHV